MTFVENALIKNKNIKKNSVIFTISCNLSHLNPWVGKMTNV